MKTFTSGATVSQGSYKAFIPNAINRDWEVSSMEVISLLSRASRLLGQLDMYSGYVNIDLYLSMHIAKEAMQSSRIEGTQTNMEEVFMKKEEVAKEKRDDWEELQNYIKAMSEATGSLQALPFSSRLIRQTHKILLQGVRGKHKQPGEFRTSQNWIGGAAISDARFVPPPHTAVPALMSDLEKFANNESNSLPELLKIALIHYQFETIHPFLDGNGRIGRLLITLYLVNKGLLKQPILYLSDFFERHRDLYYDNLTLARTKNDINHWLKFFLTGIIQTADKGIKTFDEILQLQKTLGEKITTLGSRAADANKVADELYTNPIINAARVEQIIGKSNVSAYKLIADMEKIGILRKFTGGQRGRLYAFHEYLSLF
ncbi:MAG: Fic family protein [Prevotellaceae bacterium]|jgi:Fic family protein|nr:Fic family protein [Prevotellaceae bacterium]